MSGGRREPRTRRASNACDAPGKGSARERPAYHTDSGLRPRDHANDSRAKRLASRQLGSDNKRLPVPRARGRLPMSIPASHRPAREWLLLILALLIVGGAVAPVWKLLAGPDSREDLAAKWTPERLTRLFIGPEQVLCYVCAVWTGLIL